MSDETTEDADDTSHEAEAEAEAEAPPEGESPSTQDPESLAHLARRRRHGKAPDLDPAEPPRARRVDNKGKAKARKKRKLAKKSSRKNR